MTRTTAKDLSPLNGEIDTEGRSALEASVLRATSFVRHCQHALGVWFFLTRLQAHYHANELYEALALRPSAELFSGTGSRRHRITVVAGHCIGAIAVGRLRVHIGTQDLWTKYRRSKYLRTRSWCQQRQTRRAQRFSEACSYNLL